MPITKPESRQWPLVAIATINFDDYTDAVAEEAIDMPPDSEVIGGEVVVDTAWDSATSATIDVGDGSDTDRYTATPIDLKTLGRTALTLTGFKYTASDTIDALIDHNGAPTVGQCRLLVEYIRHGRGNEVYGGS